MKKIYAVLLFAILIHHKTDAQYFMQAAGGVVIDEGLSIATTPSGESYITGYYSGVATFGSSTLNSTGLTDGFVSKLNAGGSFVWTNSFGGAGIDKGLTIATDNLGNVYVGCAFELTATIGSNTFTSFGLRDILIAKYDATGNLLWAQQAGGSNNDQVNSISVDNAGNIAITGTFTGVATFGSNTLTSTINPATAIQSADIFITKLNTSGTFLWSKNGNAVNDDKGVDVAFDQTGAVYLYAQFSDTLTFDVTHNNNINNAVCLIKFDSSGNEVWFKKFVGTSTEPTSIAVDASNHIIAVGNFTGTLNVFTTPFATLTATYSNRYYVLRFDDNGNLDWLAAKSSDSQISANDVVTGANNNIYIIGDFECRLNDFADAYGQGVFCSVGYGDVFSVGYDSNGVWQWARQCGGPKDDAAYSAGIDANDFIYFTGSFEVLFNAPLTNSNGSCFSTNTVSPYCGDNAYNLYCPINSSNILVAGNRDVLAARCIDLAREPYDYFVRAGAGCVRDELSICINDILNGVNCPDTILLCPFSTVYLGVTTFYTGVNSPNIQYVWSNGSTGGIIAVYGGGTYTVTVTTEDGCFSRSKSIFIGTQPSPLTPLISDGKGINVNACPTMTDTICAGDSLMLWATNISPGFIYYWQDNNGVSIYNDTITATQTGTYYFHVGSPNQCPTVCLINVVVSEPIPPGPFKIRVDNDYNQDDTVVSCGNNIQVSFIDSVTSVCFPFAPQWSINPSSIQFGGGSPCIQATTSFVPDSTGLYTISVIYIVNDSCNQDTIGPISKQVYFIKLAVPAEPILNITGITELCPSGDTTTLICDSAANYAWSGPSIISNDTLQSVQVNQPGTYTVTSTVYSVDGCMAMGGASINVNYKSNPVIGITPIDGTICPNDSVLMVCYTPGSYQWIGPSGSMAVDSFIVYASQPGSYYCIVTDTDGCVLVSNTVVAQSFSSPTLLVTPSNMVCNGSTATLQLIAGIGSAWQWQPPLSGSSAIQIVDSAGTYTCAVLSCNLTFILSATITSPVFPTALTSNGSTTICFGDSVQLTAPAGYNYLWFPTGEITPSIYANSLGYYYVQLTDSNGCYGYTDSVFVNLVSQPALPILTSNSPVCEGDSIILNAAATPGLTYSWNGPSGFTSTINNPVISNVSLADSGVYSLNVLDGGCSSDTISININVLAKPNAPALNSNSPLCAGDSLTLTANGTSLQSYQWNGPSGFSSTIQNPVIANTTNANAGTYTVVGYDGACYSDTSIVGVQVNTIPANPVITSNSPVCEGSSLQLTAISNAADFNWTGPGGFTSTLQNPVITNVQLSNAGSYYLIAANGNCPADTVAYTVTVNPTPPSPVASLNSPVCEGEDVQLNCNASPAATIAWNGPNGFTSGISNPQITNAQLQNGGWYTVTASLNGCNSLPDSVLLTVNPNPPTPNITGNNIICETDTIILNTASIATNYYWIGPNGFTSSLQQIIIYPASAINAGVYQLVINYGFCFSDTATVTVTVNVALPSPTINGNSPLCEGDDLFLNTSTSGVINYQWNGPAGFTSTDQNPVITNVTANNSGAYSLIVSNGCESAPSAITIIINQNPSVTNISSNSPVCVGDELQLVFSATDFDSAFWNLNSTIFSANSNLIIQNVQLNNTGFYVINLSNSNCKNADSLLVEIKDCEIIIPNVFTPNDDGYNDVFEIINSSIENIRYKIFDRWGVVVYEGYGSTLKWNGKLNGTGNFVPTGAYFYIFDITFTDKTQKKIKGYFELLR
ncbi:MAG: gliding motility-associated C-terminal domain-containing protein [Bacteroidia bacterium]